MFGVANSNEGACYNRQSCHEALHIKDVKTSCLILIWMVSLRYVDRYIDRFSVRLDTF